MLAEVLYVSQSVFRRGHLSDLDILDTAQRVNHQMDLTGCLIRGETWFAQSIEGPRDALQTVFSKIEADKRHLQISHWWGNELGHRRFPEWRMILADVAFDETQTERMFRDLNVSSDQKHIAMAKILEAHLERIGFTAPEPQN